MCDVPIRVSQRPRRKRVRRKSTMNQNQRRLNSFVAEISKKHLQLWSCQHSFINKSARRERRKIGLQLICEFMFNSLSQNKSLRSNSINFAPLGSSTKNCMKVGITRSALAPKHEGSTGTSRQPRVRKFCWVAKSSICARALLDNSWSRGKNARPTP